MILPDGPKALVKFALDVIGICNVSRGQRAAAYRQYGQWLETGRASGSLALANMLYAHVDRLAAHLFQPGVRFEIDFENYYAPPILRQAEAGARVLTREWERRSIDVAFAQGVRESLAYGACVLKQIVEWSIDDETGQRTYRSMGHRLVMPWQFGVYNEAVNTLDRNMEAMCETVYLTKPQVWRRIAHLPDAKNLFTRIMANSQRNEGVAAPTSFMHQVLSTAILDVNLRNATTPQPGGIVQLSNDPSFSTLGPMVAAELLPFHELTVWNDERDDWTTIQIVEPDILVAPLLKPVNLFAPGTLAYTLIQANQVAGYFWGRSEITDLMQLQDFLTATLDDIKRIFGQQVDKLLAFPGYDGLNDELYGQFRSQGYIGMPPNSSVTDLTSKMPPEAIPLVQNILQLMDRIAGFPPALAGQGEAGVRSADHAGSLQKMASPRLRDRSLLIERDCAEAGDATLSALEAKNPQLFWTEPGKEEQTGFYLSQLPADRRVSVDSHSSSPIFAQDHHNLIAFGLKAGIVDPISAVEMVDLPNKDLIISRLREKEAHEQQLVATLMQRDPKDAIMLLAGGRKR